MIWFDGRCPGAFELCSSSPSSSAPGSRDLFPFSGAEVRSRFAGRSCVAMLALWDTGGSGLAFRLATLFAAALCASGDRK